MSHPQDYNAKRIVLRHTGEEGYIPPVNVPTGVDDEAPFKNEIVVNSYSPKGGLESGAGIYLRVGEGDRENIEDQIIRIGKVIVTNDSVTATTPSVPYRQSSTGGRLLETGELWLRKSDHALFVHDGNRYVRVSPIPTSTNEEGVIELSTIEEALEGRVANKAITPEVLSGWREELQLLARQTDGRVIYVDQTLGDDSLENNGLDSKYPFLTIERALLQAALVSYVPGPDNDSFQYSTIVINSGDYTIDNRPGLSHKDSLQSLPVGSTGPINPVITESVLTSIDLEQSLFIVSETLQGTVLPNNQIYNGNGASAVIEQYTDEGIKVRSIRGQWSPGDNIIYSNYSDFNPPKGGVVVPRGCSVIGIDLRKCIIRPRYLGNFDEWQKGAGPCTCAEEGLSARFKITGSSYIANVTFRDSLTELTTHHLLVALISASNTELNDLNYGYYTKIAKALGKVRFPPIEGAGYQPNPLETSIVTTAVSQQEVDENGFTAVNTVQGSSAYISNCSLLSRFGARGLVVDGSLIGGFKSIVVERFTNISLQEDPRAFTAQSNAPGGQVYREEWRHASFEAQNGGYAQLVSCFTIAPADHYRALSGGELSLANCFTNFGDTAFVAKGYLNTAFPQTTGLRLEGIIPPKTIQGDLQEIYLGNVSGSTTADRVYSFSAINDSLLKPYSLYVGDTLYARSLDGQREYRAIVKEVEIKEDSNGSYIVVDDSDVNVNEIYENLNEGNGEVEFGRLYIKRIPDTREVDDTIYWLRVSQSTAQGIKAPQLHYIVDFNESLRPFTLTKTLFIAKVRQTTSDGSPLPTGQYHIALLTSDPNNESIDDIYPIANIDRPELNPDSSLTYKSTKALLSSLGVDTPKDNVIEAHLVASDQELAVIDNQGNTINDVTLDFKRPSTIRAFGTGLEWVGYGNYSTALPKYQTKALTQQEGLRKIRKEVEGGRVYNVGMTQDGEYILGERILDLKTGDEINLGINGATEPDEQVIPNLVVTKNLQVIPNATLNIGSAIFGIDNQTRFLNTLSKTAQTYATSERPGFIEIANNSNDPNVNDYEQESDDVAVTPKQLKERVEDQLVDATKQTRGLIRIADDANGADYANEGLDTVAVTPKQLLDRESLINQDITNLDSNIQTISTYVQKTRSFGTVNVLAPNASRPVRIPVPYGGRIVELFGAATGFNTLHLTVTINRKATGDVFYPFGEDSLLIKRGEGEGGEYKHEPARQGEDVFQPHDMILFTFSNIQEGAREFHASLVVELDNPPLTLS